MHNVVIHIQSWKGDAPAEFHGAPGSLLLTHHLVVDGYELRAQREGEDGDDVLEWTIAGRAGKAGTLSLDIVDPPAHIAARFPDEERLESAGNILSLPIRSIKFDWYLPPPPLTEFERMTAGR